MGEVIGEQTVHVTCGSCVVVARPCYIFGIAVKLEERVSCYTKQLQLGCNLQSAASNLDCSVVSK